MPAGVDSKVAESGRASGAGTPRQTEAGPEAVGLPSHPGLAMREPLWGKGRSCHPRRHSHRPPKAPTQNSPQVLWQ